MDEKRIEAAGAKPLKDEFDRINRKAGKILGAEGKD